LTLNYAPKSPVEFDWLDWRDEIKLAIRASMRRVEHDVLVQASDRFVYLTNSGESGSFDSRSALTAAVEKEAKRLAS
jgi:hypothetical protein